MMNVESTLMMAAYNHWMNDKLYAVCAGMPDDERKLERGSFFGSIHGTLNHLLLADRIWLGRFTGKQFHVDGLDQELYADFDELRAERSKTDDDLDCWVASLTDEALRAPFEFRSITNPEPRTMSLWVCVMHLFNHQTHHRGQLTTLLAQAGQDYGVTDLLWLPT